MKEPKKYKSSWNYRVMAHASPIKKDKRVYFQIHEVHYKDGIPQSYSEGGAKIGGDTIKELKNVATMIMDVAMITGSKIPKNKILWAGDKFPQEFEK